MSGHTTGESGERVLQLGYLHLKSRYFSLGRREGRLGGGRLQLVGHAAFQLVAEEIQRLAVALHGGSGDAQLLIQHHELQVTARHLAQQGDAQIVEVFLHGSRTGRRTLHALARSAPEVQFPGSGEGR